MVGTRPVPLDAYQWSKSTEIFWPIECFMALIGPLQSTVKSAHVGHCRVSPLFGAVE